MSMIPRVLAPRVLAPRVLATSVVAAFAAAAMSAPGQVEAQGTLEGRVLASGTGAGLAGAQVSLATLGIGSVTGPQGRYTISGVPAGTHEVAFSFIGYSVELREVVVADGQTTRLDRKSVV